MNLSMIANETLTANQTQALLSALVMDSEKTSAGFSAGFLLFACSALALTGWVVYRNFVPIKTGCSRLNLFSNSRHNDNNTFGVTRQRSHSDLELETPLLKRSDPHPVGLKNTPR